MLISDIISGDHSNLSILLEGKRKKRIRTKKPNQNLELAIKKTKKSQEELATEAGVDPSTISRYKTGIREPSISTLRRLAKSGIDVGSAFKISG